MTASRRSAGVERGAGTAGTTLGTSAPMRLTVMIVTAMAAWTASTRGMAVGEAKGESTDSASTAAPTESVAAPVTEMRPFMPTRTPGVMSP